MTKCTKYHTHTHTLSVRQTETHTLSGSPELGLTSCGYRTAATMASDRVVVSAVTCDSRVGMHTGSERNQGCRVQAVVLGFRLGGATTTSSGFQVFKRLDD